MDSKKGPGCNLHSGPFLLAVSGISYYNKQVDYKRGR